MVKSINAKNEKSEKTKYIFVDALKMCMKERAVDSITIKQICEKSGLTRQTFYRNFMDKYHLINWYFDKILFESFERMGSGDTIYEGLVRKFKFIKEEHLFFLTAFKSDDQNSLKNHDFRLIVDFYCNLIKEKTGEAPQGEILFLLEMYCKGSVYMTVNWVLGIIDVSEEKLAQLLLRAMPPELMELFKSLGVLGEYGNKTIN